MSTVATSSRLSPPPSASSTGINTVRRPGSDVFRPISKLPLDPFADLDDAQPWLVDYDALQSAIFQHESRRGVFLLVGEPTTHDISHLVSSSALSGSLLIIASSAPPPLPDLTPTGPQIRILRPASHDPSSALKLVSILERASNLARQWRDSPADAEDRVLQFSELGGIDGGQFDNIEEPIFASQTNNLHPEINRPLNRYPSPAPSTASSHSSNPRSSPLNTPPPTRPGSFLSPSRSRPSSLYSFLSKSGSMSSLSSADSAATDRSKSSKTQKHRKRKPHKIKDGDVRAFDAIINFVPPQLRGGEKAALKSVVLLTTLGGGFMAGRPHGQPVYNGSMRMKTHSSPMSLAQMHGNMVDLNDSPPQNTRTSQLRKSTSTDVIRSIPSGKGKLREGSPDSLPTRGKPDRQSKRFSLSLSSIFNAKPTKSAPQTPIGEDPPPTSPPPPPIPRLSQHPQQHYGSFTSPHIIHVVPPAYFFTAASPPPALPSSSSAPPSAFPRPPSGKRKKPFLIQSIEQFLLSYSYPLLSSAASPPVSASGQQANAGGASHYPRPPSTIMDPSSPLMGGMTDGAGAGKPLAYLTPSSVFAASLNERAVRWLSAGEAILFGVLDPSFSSVQNGHKGSARVWLHDSADILVKGAPHVQGAPDREEEVSMPTRPVVRRPSAVNGNGNGGAKLRKRESSSGSGSGAGTLGPRKSSSTTRRSQSYSSPSSASPNNERSFDIVEAMPMGSSPPPPVHSTAPAPPAIVTNGSLPDGAGTGKKRLSTQYEQASPVSRRASAASEDTSRPAMRAQAHTHVKPAPVVTSTVKQQHRPKQQQHMAIAPPLPTPPESNSGGSNRSGSRASQESSGVASGSASASAHASAEAEAGVETKEGAADNEGEDDDDGTGPKLYMLFRSSSRTSRASREEGATPRSPSSQHSHHSHIEQRQQQYLQHRRSSSQRSQRSTYTPTSPVQQQSSPTVSNLERQASMRRSMDTKPLPAPPSAALGTPFPKSPQQQYVPDDARTLMAPRPEARRERERSMSKVREFFSSSSASSFAGSEKLVNGDASAAAEKDGLKRKKSGKKRGFGEKIKVRLFR